MPSNQGGTFRKEHLDWASAENPNGKTPRLTSANKNNWYDSSFWMKSAAYLRLKNIQLGYELPKNRKTVDLGDVIAQPAGHSCNIGAGCNAAIDRKSTRLNSSH